MFPQLPSLSEVRHGDSAKGFHVKTVASGVLVSMGAFWDPFVGVHGCFGDIPVCQCACLGVVQYGGYCPLYYTKKAPPV